MRYANLNFWYALCFWSIHACYLELDQINVRFILLASRQFDWCIVCMILEKNIWCSLDLAGNGSEKMTTTVLLVIWFSLGLVLSNLQFSSSNQCLNISFFSFVFLHLTKTQRSTFKRVGNLHVHSSIPG